MINHMELYILKKYFFLKKNFYDLFLWMGFNGLKATEPLQGDSLLFTTTIEEQSINFDNWF